MSDFERVNTPRIDKAVKLLELVGKSAKSTRETTDDLLDMIRPLEDALEEIAPAAEGGTPAPVDDGPERQGSDWAVPHAPTWATIHDMARNAPLGDLSVAMAVYTSRVNDMLAEQSDDA